jgi:hypothetical protein
VNPQNIQRLARIVCGEHHHAVALKDLLDAGQVARFVINDEHRDRVGSRRFAVH